MADWRTIAIWSISIAIIVLLLTPYASSFINAKRFTEFCQKNTTTLLVGAEKCTYIGFNKCECCIQPLNDTAVCKIFEIKYDANNNLYKIVSG